jgi:hypothetical protein
MGKNSLFVVGRNIYQAACGSSASAQHFIENFRDATRGFDEKKRRAILDGILFEIFFNAKGELRESIKGSYFNEVFELQRFADLKESFDFIAEALTAAGGEFHAVPGMGHELAVTVSTKKKKNDGTFIEAIYIGGVDVLRVQEDTWGNADDTQHYSRIGPERLNKRLSEELVVPARSLKITYTPSSASQEEALRIAMGWTVRKG